MKRSSYSADDKKGKPLYELTIEKLKNEIIDKSTWAPGMKIPAERELAEELSVSRNTIRNALSVLIQAGYLYSEVGRGTFVNSKIFWGKKDIINKSKLVGIIITDIKFNFGKKIIHGVEDYLHQRGYSLILCQDHGNIQKTYKYVNTLIDHGIKGIILDPVLTDHFLEDNINLVKRFDEEQIPVVLIDRQIPEVGKHTIVTNNEEISFQAAGYLLQNNHKRIIAVGNSTQVFLDRRNGVEQAYKQRRLSVSNCKNIIIPSHDDIGKDSKLLASILSDLSGYTAVFSLSEYFGAVTFRAFSRLNMKVPQDISFITFDHPDESFFEGLEITCIEQPLIKMGNEAGKAIVNLIEHKKSTPLRKVIKSKLIFGGSVVPH
ncbi:MAG: GntR family transcriptional regulator [Spirochaetota bacterium]